MNYFRAASLRADPSVDDAYIVGDDPLSLGPARSDNDVPIDAETPLPTNQVTTLTPTVATATQQPQKSNKLLLFGALAAAFGIGYYFYQKQQQEREDEMVDDLIDDLEDGGFNVTHTDSRTAKRLSEKQASARSSQRASQRSSMREAPRSRTLESPGRTEVMAANARRRRRRKSKP